ncbi:hypothetical protein CLV30_101476 [Haloactinopolyspora alba]|uniref:Uncharacterized protein n=1 Tax=Haloactinopolyspora alba TaxID=648780 RepID=A0A2P8EGD3_9ACTN|nr:hypothetical protein [Haloactinopolyspora alba]PSL08504.1 hypothetical protein CLV30_101476 [Haloactinopolyspora alba]
MGDVVVAFFVVLVLAWAAGAVWFFRGPARATDRCLEQKVLSIPDEHDQALFRQLYAAKRPRGVVVAWVLTAVLSPTVSYVYQREWPKALLALLTFQGFGLWWLVSIFTMPTEVMRHNKRLIDQAFVDLKLARPGLQQVNVFAGDVGVTGQP